MRSQNLVRSLSIAPRAGHRRELVDEMTGFLQRLRGRLRHGLLIQEILDRLSKLGLTFCPYLLMVQTAEKMGSTAVHPHGFSTRLLMREDVPLLTAMIELERAQQIQNIDGRLPGGQLGVGIFRGSEFAGYSWCNLDHCHCFRRSLFKLNDNEAYLFDTYIRRPFRGQGLAAVVWRALCAALVDQGRSAFYSVTFCFNAPSRRYKKKLGIEKMELRLYIRCFGLWEKDLLLKRYLSRPPRERADGISRQSSVLTGSYRDSGSGEHDRAV